MNTNILVAIGVVLAIVVIAGVLLAKKRRSERLRQRFGPEYERAVREQGDPRRAEAALEQREKRVERFQIRPLPPEVREVYLGSWADVQRRFVDDPSGAVANADDLITRVMQHRGYPMGDFEQRAADVSVDHPGVVEHYRAAHAIAIRHRRGEAGTEDMRQAMVHYRKLFEDLLEVPSPEQRPESREVA